MLGSALVAMGLLAGLFLTFDVVVMPALTAAEDRTLVDAMQQMIELPAFPLLLFAALALAIAAFIQAQSSNDSQAAAWTGAALGLYGVMVVVSMAVHFPLNDELMQAGELARIEDLAAVRDEFVAQWVPWNIVRSLALIAAFGCLVQASILRGRRRAARDRDGEASRVAVSA